MPRSCGVSTSLFFTVDHTSLIREIKTLVAAADFNWFILCTKIEKETYGSMLVLVLMSETM